MCKYTKKHKCRDPHYEVTINGNSSIYCDEAISQAVENGNVVVVLRHLTPRPPDACPYCAGKGEFVNVIGKALRCNHCAGTGQRR
jgi:hypothetical protein